MISALVVSIWILGTILAFACMVVGGDFHDKWQVVAARIIIALTWPICLALLLIALAVFSMVRMPYGTFR